MPKRSDLKSILIIGAGPIVIGQACEFDYSGAQACQALKEEGYRVILVNSNPATIMTDPSMADATYIEPVNWQIAEKIIERERPDAILPTMGGQTALNCALDLNKHGVLKKYNVELIGAKVEAIDKAEDRELFDNAMKAIGLETARHGFAHNLEEAREAQEQIGFPCIIRPSFTLGGSGGGIAYNKDEAKLTVVGVPDKPGIAYSILGPIADANIEVDMIVQNVSADGATTDLTFTVPSADYERARVRLEKSKSTIGYETIDGSTNVAKVSVIGIGMRSHAGVAAEAFKALSEQQINILAITTSEIKFSVLINAAQTDLAVRTLHTLYGLDKA